MKKVIYTVITDKYELLVNPTFISSNFDYICFTDDLSKSNTIWQLKHIPKDLLNLSKVKQLRLIKICPHKYLPEYDLSIYIDGSVDILDDLNLFLKDILKENKSVYIPKHPARDCIYDESIACLEKKKDVESNIILQINKYKSENFPKHFGLVLSGIIIRNHNDPYSIKLMDLWKELLIKYSHRDLLSFNYCLWKMGNDKFEYLNSDLFDSKWFKWHKKHDRKMINVIDVNPESKNQYCVFSVLDTENGKLIEKEMREWLEPNYHLIEVWHDGSLFEYPALKYMLDLCIKNKCSCLYIHTKGAFFQRPEALNIRNIWKYEFTVNKDLYFGLVNRPWAVVACIGSGSDKTTWYNGWVTNWKAMSEIPTIEPNNNRFKFERLFIKQKPQVIGVMRNDLHRELGNIHKKLNNAWKQISD